METILALRRGDRQVFEELFYRYHERIYFYVLGKTQSSYLADEAVQLTFIKLWQYREHLSTEHNLLAQLFRIARTTMIDLVRKDAHRLKISGAEDGMERSGNESVASHMAVRDIQSMLQLAMQQMPPMRRRVFTLSRMNGMSIREIAAELFISTKTVEGHITEALKQVRQHITILTILYLLS